MQKLEDFITSLSNHELALFYYYQYDNLLDYAKDIMNVEIANRNLNKDEFLNLSKERLNYDNTNYTCVKCGYDKFITDTDTEHKMNSEYSSYDELTLSKRCRLCNYNPSKDNKKSRLKKLKEFIFGDKNKKLIITKDYNW